ncbi:MAG: prolyl oligopeptidase family serine peptidase, partial [Cytophagaceae bacterium]|nr:prolyl oligopeptidase family serine peptidase [Cytophagaceae bacterium]
MKKVSVFLFGIMAIITACNLSGKTNYPVTEKDATVDVYFGTEVPDPYRWLENDTSQATLAWVEAQNKVTSAYLSQIPFRDKLKQRLTQLTDYEKIGTPIKRNGKYYFFKNDGLQNQSVMYVKKTLDGEAEVLLDPNTLSDDGTVALTDINFSNDGKYLAYSISRSGSDWNEIFVLDLATREFTGDHIEWAKFSGAAWHNNGFYYSAYDAPVEGKEYSHKNENHKIYYHQLGKPQSDDKLVYENKEHPKRFYSASVDEDERFMFIIESGAEKGNNLYVTYLKNDIAGMKHLAAYTINIRMTNNMDYSYYPVGVVDDKIYILTNFESPRYRIMVADAGLPLIDKWEELIPETESVLSNAQIIGGKLFVTYDKDASNHAFVFELDNKRVTEIKLPTLGSVSFSGTKNDSEVFYSFTSFTFPATIYKYNIDACESTLYLAPKVAFNPEEYTTEQVFYPSKDGTKIPMFLTYKKDLKKDGNNPVLLYGYGGFNVPLNPGFSTSRLPFLENGGIYAQANLRGGGEYGEEWHEAGTLMNKQNVFDDFIAAAEYLIGENYTNSSRVAIFGGSNGGLLVGAVANQRPDLFKVAVPAVGVMDMLRYH